MIFIVIVSSRNISFFYYFDRYHTHSPPVLKDLSAHASMCFLKNNHRNTNCCHLQIRRAKSLSKHIAAKTH